MLRSRLWLVLLLAVLTAGCRVGPQPEDREWSQPGTRAQRGDLTLVDVRLAAPGGRPYLPGSDVPAYGRIVNDGDRADTLLDIRTPAAPRVDLVGPNGAVCDQLTVPAHGYLDLDGTAPYSVLRQVNRLLRAGDFVPVTFRFARTGEFTFLVGVRVPVSAPSTGSPR